MIFNVPSTTVSIDMSIGDSKIIEDYKLSLARGAIMADEDRKEDLLKDNPEDAAIDSDDESKEEEEIDELEEPDKDLIFPDGFKKWYDQQGPARYRPSVVHKPKKVDFKGKVEVRIQYEFILNPPL